MTNVAIDRDGDLAATDRDGERQQRTSRSRYRVTPGITFNTANGPLSAQLRIVNKIIAAIKHTPKGEVIRIMTWNFASPRAVDALLDAQRRGVKIRLLMDSANRSASKPNPAFSRLKAGLRNGNKGRRAKNRSYAKECNHACRRDARGAAHGKYYLFTRVGRSENVLIQGSANLTTAGSLNQWNEVYTYVGKRNLFNFTKGIFSEMWRDKAVPSPWETYYHTNGSLSFSPAVGADYKGHPHERALRRVKCTGAIKAGNANGRTIIRFFPDVLRNDPGMRVARQLRGLWNNGCDVKIGYTVIGIDIKRYLQQSSGRGPVPLRHMVQDFDGDRDFDNYFHLKVLTINGVMGKDRTAFWAMNGSTNTSRLSYNSDENIGTFKQRRVVRRYQGFLDYWWNNPPPSVAPRVSRQALPEDFDPYVHVDMD